MLNHEPTYKPSEVAAIWDCHYDTVLNYIHRGFISAFRTPTGRWRIRQSDLSSFQYQCVTRGSKDQLSLF